MTVPTCVNPVGQRALFSTTKAIMALIPSFPQVAQTKVNERDLAIRCPDLRFLNLKVQQQEGQGKLRNYSVWMQQ